MECNVAFIILNYNRHDETLNCINSIHDSFVSYHIFLVDNYSNEIERDLLKKNIRNIPEITLLLPEKNLGFAGGVNLALRKAISEGFSQFFLLNNDAAFLPESGKSIETALTNNPGSLISPTIRWGDSICRGNYYHNILGLITKSRPCISAGFFYYFSGCALAFDKSVIDKIGFLNEDFFMYGEDIDFCYKAVNEHILLVLIDKVLISHEGSKSAQIASLFYEYHVARSHFLLTFLLQKNLFMQAITLTTKGIVLFIRAVLRCTRYNTLVPFVAFLIAPFHKDIKPPKP